MTTHDTDIGLQIPLELIGGRTLSERMTNAGFEVYTAGGGKEKAFFYKHRDRSPGEFSPIHVEFISPMTGYFADPQLPSCTRFKSAPKRGSSRSGS
jgi:hypothetical protein